MIRVGRDEFFSIDRDIGRCLNPQADFTVIHPYDGHDDVVADDDPFPHLPRQD
jgi:hypothetical protein